MHHPRSIALFLVSVSSFILLPSAFAAAPELSLSLPLGPFYRPGKYLPVRVTAALPQGRANAWVGLAADNVTSRTDISRGAGRTGIDVAQGRVDAVVPWLVIDGRAKRPRLFAEEPFAFVDGPELRRLADDERLVGWTTPDEPFARQLLSAAGRGGATATGPAPRIIPVALDPAQPVRGSPAAWELLDAILLDAASAARLDQSQLAGLVAAGVVVAVRSDSPPFPNWPWRRVGQYAVLKHEPAGPTTAGYHEQAYLPVADWQPGWPWAFRRRVVLIAAVCSILFLGLALWRPPHTVIWAALLAGTMCFGIGHWWGMHLAVQQAAGEVVVIDPDGLTQTDGWTYQTSSADRVSTLRWVDVARPIFASNAGADDVWINLICSPAGQPETFDIRIPANRKVAFLSRSVGPRAPKSTPQTPVTSPLADLADKLYCRDAGKVTGQLPGAPASAPAYGYVQIQQWNAVVVDRRR